MKQDLATALTNERLDLCDYLATLDHDNWSTPSLCAGWTVHHVLAHLVNNTQVTAFGITKELLRGRGNFNRMIDRQTRERAAAFSPSELLADLRIFASSTRRAPGASPLDPLTDVLVHGQDIARTIDRPRTIPTHLAVLALQHAANSHFYGSTNRFHDIHLMATDTQWSSGKGPATINGPVADLLLVATGRCQGLRNITGDGAAIVAKRMTQN